jgi:hypothetical protein
MDPSNNENTVSPTFKSPLQLSTKTYFDMVNLASPTIDRKS